MILVQEDEGEMLPFEFLGSYILPPKLTPINSIPMNILKEIDRWSMMEATATYNAVCGLVSHSHWFTLTSCSPQATLYPPLILTNSRNISMNYLLELLSHGNEFLTRAWCDFTLSIKITTPTANFLLNYTHLERNRKEFY